MDEHNKLLLVSQNHRMVAVEKDFWSLYGPTPPCPLTLRSQNIVSQL